jgi:selenocysteine lyase/cysteine desulfurase
VIALPADARTREQLEWLAEGIIDAAGSATIWLAHPATTAAERELATRMADARAGEYAQVIAAAHAASEKPASERTATGRKLRAELRRVERRDYFPPPERDTARLAVQQLTAPAPATGTPADAEVVEQP